VDAVIQFYFALDEAGMIFMDAVRRSFFFGSFYIFASCFIFHPEWRWQLKWRDLCLHNISSE